MTDGEAQKFFEKVNEEKIKRFTDVGFTEEQAKVLLNVIKESALIGGFF